MSQRRTARRPVQVDDLFRIRIPGDAQASPNGAVVLFGLRVASASRPGEYEKSLWTVPCSGGPPRRFTAGLRDGGGRWSPDGSRVAFVRAEPKHRPQVWTIDAAGGEAHPLTDFAEGSIGAMKWSPDGSRLAVAFRPVAMGFTDADAKQRKERGESDPPREIDDIWYRLDGDGYFGGARYALHVVDAATGRSRVVFDRDSTGEFSFDWSPDGSRLAVTANTSRRASFEPWLDDLFIVGVDDRRISRLEGAPVGPKSAVAWSPDGRSIAWAGREDMRDGLYSPDNLGLWVAEIPAGPARGRAGGRALAKAPPAVRLANARCLTERDDVCLMAATLSDVADASFAAVVLWSRDSSRIFTRIGVHGVGRVASIARAGGRIAYHTRDGDRSIGNFSRDGRTLALVAIGPMSLPEVAAATVGGPPRAGFRQRTLTALNSELAAELALAKPESHWIVAADGQKSQAWVLRPPHAGPRTRTPAILMVHGGPHAQYGEVFFHEMQVMAAQGYTVLMGNPRGSKGYGERFCGAIRGAWGGEDWMDVQSYLLHLQGRGDVDPKRIAIAGGSYGGYMANWAIGHTHAFRCAVTDRCVSNLLSMGGNSDYPDSGDYWPGKVWDGWESRWEGSPIKHFKGVRTPTLVIHSEGDLRCNIEQGEEVFTALQDLGVPTRFIRYPASTSHGMSRTGPPDLRRHRLRAMIDWFTRWLR